MDLLTQGLDDLLHMFDAADVEEVSWEATAFAVNSGMNEKM